MGIVEEGRKDVKGCKGGVKKGARGKKRVKEKRYMRFNVMKGKELSNP
jgi:hypothetical protein